MSDENAQAVRVPFGKRAFDIVVALTALVVFSPLLLVVALLVKLTSRGPLLFSHQRYGLGKSTFAILKFRKMAATVRGGGRTTAKHDFRMTGLGRLLERTKLDELPQLINVLRGEMSIVGPRPEDPELADHYPDAFDTILTTPPGLVGPNQLALRNESDLYPQNCLDRDRYYIDEILPQKVEVDLAYAKGRSLLGDLWIVLRAVPVVLFGILSMGTIRSNPAVVLHLLVFPLLVAGALTASFLLHFDLTIPATEVRSFWFLLAVLVPVQTACFFAFSNHHVITKYFNVLDLKEILKASFLGTGVALLVSLSVQFTSHSRVVLVLHTFLLIVLGVFWMSLFRQFPHWWKGVRGDVGRRLRGTLAYSLLGGVAFLLGYGLRFGFGLNIFDHPLLVVALGACLINGLVFFLLQGFDSLNRVISFGHHYELLKITVVSSGAIYAVAFFGDIERGFPRSLLMIEAILKYALLLIAKFSLARFLGTHETNGEARVRTLLVGSLDDVDLYFRSRNGTSSGVDLVGVVLLQGYYDGMSIHSEPILGEVSAAKEIVEQLGVERLLLLAPSCQDVLREQGIEDGMMQNAAPDA